MEIKHKQEIGVLKQNIQYLTDEKKTSYSLFATCCTT